MIKRLLVFHPAFLVLPLFILWSAAHLDGFSWDYDEGIHVYIAWLVQRGHTLYAQTFSPYTPGFIVPLAAAFSIFGATIVVARMLAVLMAALGVLGVALAARELVWSEDAPLRGALAELSACVLLIFAPAFLQWSRAAMSDLPAAALSALAVALALVHLRRQQLRWLFAGEGVFAYALWVKLIAAGGAAGLALALGFGLRRQPGGLKRVLAGTLLVGLLAAVPLFLFDVRGLFEQAVYFHVQKRGAFDQSTADRLGILADFLLSNQSLLVLAVLGAFAPLALHRRLGAKSDALLVILAWLGATFVSLLFQDPLFANHHPVVLALPLAVLGGAGIVAFTDLVRAVVSPDGRLVTPSRAALPLVVLAIGLVGVITGIGQYPDQLNAAVAPPLQPAAEEAVSLLRAVIPSDDLIVSDAQMIAFRAQRQSPPALADTSSARLASDNLTADRLIAVTQASGANAVMFWSGRLETAALFVDWVGQNYHLVRSSFQKPSSPYRFYLRVPHPQYPLNAQFGDGIALLGYDLNRRADPSVAAGSTLSVTLYFQRVGAVGRSYTIFTHLLGPGGVLLAQDDHPPLAGRYPTDQWQSGEIIVDEFTLSLAADSASGALTAWPLEIGMYAPDTLQRLPVSLGGIRQPDDRLLLSVPMIFEWR